MKAWTAPLVAEITAFRGQLALVEARAPVPGPAGPPGPPGADGRPGQDGAAGADGVGFEDLAVTFDGDRTITLSFTRGADVKAFPIVLPFQKYRGVFTYGHRYVVGDTVTHGGSCWHCETPTELPPRPELREWSLVSRHGRDLRDRGPRG